MDPADLRYRALLARIYSEYLVGDLDRFTVVYDGTERCIAIASALAALAEARGASVEASTVDDMEEVENAMLILTPELEGLPQRAAKALAMVRSVAALHTPVYYALEEVQGLEALLEGKEVRFGVREAPDEVEFYRLAVRGGEGRPERYAVKRLTPAEARVIRAFEALKRDIR